MYPLTHISSQDGGKKKSDKASEGKRPAVSMQDTPTFLPTPLIGPMKRNGGKIPLSEMKFKKKAVSAQKSTAQRQAEASSSRGKGDRKPKKDEKGKGRAK